MEDRHIEPQPQKQTPKIWCSLDIRFVRYDLEQTETMIAVLRTATGSKVTNGSTRRGCNIDFHETDRWMRIAGDDGRASAFSALVRPSVVWRRAALRRVETLRRQLGTYATTARKMALARSVGRPAGRLAWRGAVVVSSSILSNIDSVVAGGNLLTPHGWGRLPSTS